MRAPLPRRPADLPARAVPLDLPPLLDVTVLDVSATRPDRRRPTQKPLRTPKAAGAAVAAAAVAVTGFVVLESTGDSSSVVDSAAAMIGEVGDFSAASLDGEALASDDPRASRSGLRGSLAGADGLPEEVHLANAARARARALLADRIEAVERKAAEAAKARLVAHQRACGYNPYIQRGLTSTAEQRRNARTIMRVAEQMGLPRRAAVIAIATALQESFLKNVNHGHLDSRGLFQQRPSAGWGRPSQIMNPEYAARSFYRKLKEIDGWRRLPVTVAAQRVQISAFPWAYARWERAAAQLVRNETQAKPEALLCTPRR